MLNLSARAFGPSASVEDTLTFMTSVAYLNTLQSEKSNAIVEQIIEQLASFNTRLIGLNMLEFALKQNPKIYFEYHWLPVLYDILKEPISNESKQKICKIMLLIIPILKEAPNETKEDIQRLHTNICPFLCKAAQSDLEWNKAAVGCLAAVAKAFPSLFVSQKDMFFKVIMKHTDCISTKSFEVFAEFFCHLPLILPNAHPLSCLDSWTGQYERTLNTMNFLLNNLLRSFPEEKKVNVQEDSCFVFDFEDVDDFETRFRQTRQFINLCQCTAKILKSKTKFKVDIPFDETLECIKRVFDYESISKLDQNSFENCITLSSLAQLQIAALNVLEPILVNFNSEMYALFIVQLLKCGLKISELNNISKHSVSQVRRVIWKLLTQWISAKGSKLASTVGQNQFLIKHLLQDIDFNPPSKSAQTTEINMHGKTKKNSPSNVTKKNNYRSHHWKLVCREALKALQKFIYGFRIYMAEEVSNTVFQIVRRLQESDDFSFPYTDENCRKNLYKVLLAFIVKVKPDDSKALNYSVSLLNCGIQDPSSKVSSFCGEASAICYLSVNPRKPAPYPLTRVPEDNSSWHETNSGVQKFGVFGESEVFVENIPPQEVPKEPEIAQSLLPNDASGHSNDFSQMEIQYEQDSENQCNGDDILEIQNTSREDEEDEEDMEDEEEEDEEEEEGEVEDEEEEEVEIDEGQGHYMHHDHEITHVQLIPESIQTIEEDEEKNHEAPVIIQESVETVEDIEYEELKPPQTNNALSNSNKTKNVHHNRVNNTTVPAESPATYPENVANENGIYEFDDEEIDEEFEEDEEEERRRTYPAEKRIPEFLVEVSAKKPKLEVPDEMQDCSSDDERERIPSPSLEEMIHDLIVPELDTMVENYP